MKHILVVGFLFLGVNCQITTQPQQKKTGQMPSSLKLHTGADRMDAYLYLLRQKNVALVVNHSARIGDTHIVDTLLSNNITISKIFCPEHGFRGQASAGETVADGIDTKTKIPIVSLYGKKKKPTPQDLEHIDIVLFDIQDVGARFYTYISTMHYMMEACAENDIPFIVLDRPNPNGHYVDGPVLQLAYTSFVGIHPIPIVHGLTIGELANMINGEKWLANGMRCDLTVITCANYTHNTLYNLPVNPSPNLPNMRSIYLYPSLCLFEGTDISVGRGTNMQFQVIGHPKLPETEFSYTPQPMPGAKYPKHEDKTCFGRNLKLLNTVHLAAEKQLNLKYIIETYERFPIKEQFFLKSNFFDKLAGTDVLRKQITKGWGADEIRDSWQADLEHYMKMREKYLLYE